MLDFAVNYSMVSISQKAAKNGWHPSDPNFNGINLDLSIHNNYANGHSTYNNNILNFFDDVIDESPEKIATPELAQKFLNRVQQNVKNQLNAGKKLDEIIISD